MFSQSYENFSLSSNNGRCKSFSFFSSFRINYCKLLSKLYRIIVEVILVMLRYQSNANRRYFSSTLLEELLLYSGKGTQKFTSLCIILISKPLTVPTVREGPNLTCYHFSKGRKWKRKYTSWNVHVSVAMKFPERKNQSLMLCKCEMQGVKCTL